MRLFVHNQIHRFEGVFTDRIKRAVFLILLIVGLTCAIINITLGGFPWAMLVFGFLRHVWNLIFDKKLFENYFSGRLMSFITGCTILLVNLIFIFANNRSLILICLLFCWSIQMLSLMTNLMQYKKSGQLSPQHLIISGGVFLLCFVVSCWISSQSMAAVSGVTLIFWGVILFEKIAVIKQEGKKRFHMA